METTHDLFVYEMGLVREIEAAGRGLHELLAHNITRDDLRQIVRAEQGECVRRQENLNRCMGLAGTPLQAKSETVEGIRQRFEDFILLQPASGIVDQFAVDTMVRFLHLGIAAHKSLIDWAILLGQSECVQYLHTNLVQKQESSAKLERFSHELTLQLLGPACELKPSL